MKKRKSYRILCLLLAFCVASSAVWYGAIALLNHRSGTTLTDVQGDASALEGITLQGTFSDPAFSYQFHLKDGKLKNQFAPHSYVTTRDQYSSHCYELAVPASGAHVTEPTIQSEDKTDTQHIKTWVRKADRIRIYLVCERYDTEGREQTEVMVDTGIELEDTENGFTFSATTVDDQLLNNWYCSIDAIPAFFIRNPVRHLSTTFTLGDTLYLYWNIPWGGAKIYRIDEMVPANYSLEKSQLESYSRDPATMLEHLTPEGPMGSMTPILEFTPSEASNILDIYPIGQEHMAVIIQRNADEPCFIPDGQGGLADTPGPDHNELAVQIYDSNYQLVDQASLAELPEGLIGEARILAFDQPGTGFDELSFLVEFFTEQGDSIPATQTAVNLRLESGQLTVSQCIQQPLQPSPNGQPAELLATQLDETGTKTALLWRSLPAPLIPGTAFGMPALNADGSRREASHLYLDVMQDGQLLYRGELNNDWVEDWTPGSPYTARQSHRQLILPLLGSSNQYVECYNDYTTNTY